MLELTFITSSREKLAHARYLCREYDIRISKQKNYGVGYVEPRTSDRTKLIEQSVRSALERWKKNVSNSEDRMFFIEDTSVVIPALSRGDSDYPGTDIKYWMRENEFSTIDRQLKEVGNDRRAIVRSDVALVLSGDLRRKMGKEYILFTSETVGRIVDEEVALRTQPFYAWLSDKTFNKWFAPGDCKSPMSALPIDVADSYDFRAGAFRQMLSFLQIQGVVLQRLVDTASAKQATLFPLPLFVVCGPTCSGKTTIADHLAEQYGYYHIEASDLMYVSYYDSHGVGSSVRIGDFAEKALSENPCIVVDQVIELINEAREVPVVVTGFRAPGELLCFQRKYSGGSDIEEVFVDADQQTRFHRSFNRRRPDSRRTYEDFVLTDRQQERMGLETLRQALRGSAILNDGSFKQYYEAFEEHFVQESRMPREQRDESIKDLQVGLNLRLEDAIILALLDRRESEQYLTTTEISKLIGTLMPAAPKNKNNVSRYFNHQFHPFYEVSSRNGKKVYRLSQTGLTKGRWLMEQLARSPEKPHRTLPRNSKRRLTR
jgi:inosine/xanthosine triphosphate pyrophosphatase family protein/cytidylate kinase